jgi:hypothetical protein
LGGAVVLCLFIVLGWFVFRQEPPPPNQQPVKVETAKPVAPVFEPDDDVSSETPTNQPENSITTNAADLYRQAFALYDALSKDEKGLLGDWRTNVDASVEAELCEKIRPICDLMHQASAVTNCDWGIEPITFTTKFPHLTASRNIARAAIWNAAHCRSNDVTGATEDVLSVLRVGHNVSRSALIGCLVDMALQNIASSYVTQNLGSFSRADNQRLTAALSDPAYEEVPSHAVEQEADIMGRMAVELTSMPAAEIEKGLSKLGFDASLHPDSPELDRAAERAWLEQIADSERELARALASSSEDEYEAWLKHTAELQASNPLAKDLMPDYDPFVNKARGEEVNRALVVAGLAVAQGGTESLPSHPDPSSGQPFVYTETADGFQLQSTYEAYGKPVTMQFKLR